MREINVIMESGMSGTVADTKPNVQKTAKHLAVLPALCTTSSAAYGGSKLMTCPTDGKSSPREATSANNQQPMKRKKIKTFN
jgi:hypothetical protein